MMFSASRCKGQSQVGLVTSLIHSTFNIQHSTSTAGGIRVGEPRDVLLRFHLELNGRY